jgi:hypothetical protein
MAMAREAKDWSELTALTQGQPMVVERVRLTDKDIAVEGRFELPQLARLAADDQVFGVSYPTIKARLNRIAAALDFVDHSPAPPRSEVLDRLSRGEISAEDAIRALEGLT